MARRISKGKNSNPYNTEDLLKEAIEIAKKNKYCWRSSDVFGLMPYDNTTLRRHKIHESEQLDKILVQNRLKAKLKKRKDLDDNKQASAQIAYYKLVADEDELNRLSLEREPEKKEDKKDNTLKIKFIGGDSDK